MTDTTRGPRVQAPVTRVAPAVGDSTADVTVEAATTARSGAPDAGTESDGERQNNVGLVVIILMLTTLLASLNQMVLSTALPTIVGELHGVDKMMWIITGYLLAATISMPVYGKISDLFGRKPVLVAAGLIFLVGSTIGALAPNMEILIAARIIQGLGGGGLMILSQAAIADVASARDRGKYSGMLNSAFAISSVAGPLLGGWFTEGPGWRWAFWITLPMGAIALACVLAFLHLPSRQAVTRPPVDYLGITLFAAATTMIVLIGTWGGATYDWNSGPIIGLGVGAVVAVVLVIIVQSRAADPVMPLTMFKERNFNLTIVAALLTSFALFGVIGYLPTYFQMAVGVSATHAGLLMIPMMAALLFSSIGSGIMVTRTGRYKRIPIVGTVILVIGLVALTTVTLSTPPLVVCGYLAVIGFGLGTSMQILVLVVQNTFPYRMVGTATAANNYFRQVGGSLGTAIIGSVFANRLTSILSERLPQGTGAADGARSFTPDLVSAMPDHIRITVVTAYNEALIPIFMIAVPLAVVAVLVLCFIKEVPLSRTVGR